jgi:hypothetical protein
MDLNLAKSPVYLKILMKESFARDLLGPDLSTVPMHSTALLRYSSSVTVLRSMWTISLLLCTTCFSVTWVSTMVIASLSLAISISIALLLPLMFRVIFSLYSSTWKSRAFRIWILLSSILVAIEYSTMSTSDEPPSILVYIKPIMVLHLRSSSMKLMSLIYLRF